MEYLIIALSSWDAGFFRTLLRSCFVPPSGGGRLREPCAAVLASDPMDDLCRVNAGMTLSYTKILRRRARAIGASNSGSLTAYPSNLCAGLVLGHAEVPADSWRNSALSFLGSEFRPTSSWARRCRRTRLHHTAWWSSSFSGAAISWKLSSLEPRWLHGFARASDPCNAGACWPERDRTDSWPNRGRSV